MKVDLVLKGRRVFKVFKVFGGFRDFKVLRESKD